MIICSKCEIEYEKSSLSGAVETMSINGPIAIQQADLWRCPGCKAEIAHAEEGRTVIVHGDSEAYSGIRYNFESRKALLCRRWYSLRDKASYMVQKR